MPLEFDHAKIALAMRVVTGFDRGLVDEFANGTLAQHQIELAGAGIVRITREDICKGTGENSARGGQ